MEFSQSQELAITHNTGPAMVLAGPGSGKTLVITNRTKHLIEKEGVKPEEILVITFTKAAATEMRERFARLCEGTRYRVNFGTFHAVFFQILKYAYNFTAENIIREDQRIRLLMELSSKYKLEFEDEKELISDLTAEISLVKNEQIPLEHYYSTTCSDSVFRSICSGYNEKLRSMGLIDFDDMLVYTWQLFKERKDILAQWQNHFRYILVDEFQDINMLQYEIVKMLAAPQDNLFVVGDDDQSIYRFRGAKPEIMLEFQKVYPAAKVIVLEDNFRSAQEIINAAGMVIRENRKRYPKNVEGSRGRGGQVEIRRLKSQDTEALYLVKCIQHAAQAGRPYKEMAILTRTNTGGRFIAEKLMEFGIPFTMQGQVPNLYDHWIAKDIFAYLRMGIGIRDRKDFLMIMNRPKRYISRDCVDEPNIDFDRLRMWYEDKAWMVRRLDDMERDIKSLQTMQPWAAVNYIRHGIRYDEFIEEYAQARRLKKEDLIEILDELQEAARPFKTTLQWMAHIEEYRKTLADQKARQNAYGAKGSAGNSEDDKEEDAILLSTLHASKGLEFEEVFLPDVNEDILPHRKAALEADLEEERRLLYVGMTRAKSILHILYIRERYGKDLEPSRFIEVFDLPE